MDSEAEKAALWRSAFSPRKTDDHAAARLRLQQAWTRMRENVAALVAMIPRDCQDLTVHDVSHLDALWEMASMLAGPNYPLNPAEAFVLGGAILLHDAGLSAAAFPRGLEDLKARQEWADIAAATLRQNGLEPTAEQLSSPPAHLLAEIKFSVLRAVHAEQAENMASSAWTLPDGSQLYLLDDPELRQAFGAAIGRVAHSHHWDIERVADTLLDNVGAGTVLPAEWAVSERKVACLLRCADAAHIDRRRAPTMLFAATRPTGISAIHWGAQNKLNKPMVDGSSLIYSAGEAFTSRDAKAWWLAYDLVRLVDKEVRASNALLEELKHTPLAVRRVVGAESPRALSVHIRTDGWRPIDAEVRVSDPVHLARTLGGRNLYGRNPVAPIRELLQNSADAIRARRELEDRAPTWGSIRVTIEPDAQSEAGCWLHVDDNGIGMSERVMAGPLVDFGRSIWNSPILREEFPGLQSKNIHPVGKYGIGFFSVFELSDEVSVISRHYETGTTDAKVLEFSNLASRPLIRPAKPKELPRDMSTRVSVRVNDKRRVSGLPAYYPDDISLFHLNNIKFSDSILRLIAPLDIQVIYHDKISGDSFEHSPEVLGVNSADFIDELLPHLKASDLALLKVAHAPLMREIRGKDGRTYGRAALLLTDDDEYARRIDAGYVSVGGFTYDGTGLPSPYIGIVEGYTEEAARRSARPSAPREAISAWASEQATLIDQDKFLKVHLLRAAARVLKCGGHPGPLPYCFAGGRLINYEEASKIILEQQIILLPLALQYGTHLNVIGHSRMGVNYFELPMAAEVIVPGEESDRLFDDEITRLLVKEGRRESSMKELLAERALGSGSLRALLRLIEHLWGCEPRISVETAQIFRAEVYSPPPPRWVLALRR